jgi:hypothetical protein
MLQFRQYGVIFSLRSAYFWLRERIARCAGPVVYTEHQLRSNYICGLGARGPQQSQRLFGVQVTRPLLMTQTLDFRKTTPYCLNCRYL